MSISEALSEAIDLLHVLKGSSALIYSWTRPLDADYMAVFMLDLGHSGLSPRLIFLELSLLALQSLTLDPMAVHCLHWCGFHVLM